jgi:hypothetical protein
LILGSALFECVTRPGDFCEDFFGRFGPDKGLGVGIVMVEVLVDGSFELWNEGETPRRMRSWVIKPKVRST